MSEIKYSNKSLGDIFLTTYGTYIYTRKDNLRLRPHYSTHHAHTIIGFGHD